MQWESHAILLTHKELGPQNIVVEAFTQSHGRTRGLVRASSKKRPAWLTQHGALLHVRWQARLSDQLGTFTIEPVAPSPGFFYSGAEVAIFPLVLGLLRQCPEKHPYPQLFEKTCHLLKSLSAENYIKWELDLLQHLGFALDLACCALTGSTHALAYVSPRTGRAASFSAAQPWKNQLLALPAFLTRSETLATPQCIVDGLRLTGHFLKLREIVPKWHAFWRMRCFLEQLIAKKSEAKK